MRMSQATSILIVAGEPSGDWIAARIIESLHKQDATLAFWGIGGAAMVDAGAHLVADISTLCALGPKDSLLKLPRWATAWGRLRRRCEVHRPRVAILVDCPDVNLPLARALKADGVKVLQVMGPKVWAWRKSRLSLLRDRTDMVALGFAFEKPLYDAANVRAQFVGHPLVDLPPLHNRAEVRKELHVPKGAKLVALLPGSRASELKRHGELLIETGVRLLKDGMVPVMAPHLGPFSTPIVSKSRSLGILAWQRPVRELLDGCDAALVVSGTVTLEVALAGVPMAIVYKLDRLSHAFAKKVLHIPYVGLPNWVATQQIVPEFIQQEATPAALYNQVHQLLDSKETLRQKKALADVAKQLGRKGVGDRIARLVIDWLE